MSFKEFLLLSALLFTISSVSVAQNYNWITPGRTYLKMYSSDDGVNRIDKADFTSAGITVSTIDPRTVKVYFKGSQIPIYFSGESDGVFNDVDYFDFYGTRNRGGITITYNENNVLAYTTDEYFNQYSDTNTYWIEWGGKNGNRFASSAFTSLTPYTSNFFQETLHFEKDKLFSQGQNLGDYNFLSTEKYLGEGWYWSVLNNNQTVSDTFSIPGLNTAGGISSIRVFAFPQNRDFAHLDDHKLEISVNGTIVSTLVSNDFTRFDTTVNFASSLLSSGSVNNITCKYISTAGFAGAIYFDLFELKYPKSFLLGNNKLNFDLSASADTTSKLFRVKGYNSLNPVNIYDVNNNIRITNFSGSSDTLKFTAKSNSKIEIVNGPITKKPFRIKQRQVTDLTSNTNGADFLVVYNKLFQSQAEQLRAYRSSHNKFRSVKAEIEDIYDIFNYGMEDPVAPKNFIKYVYDNWQLPKLQYICLFGRGSLDPKQNSSSSAFYNNFIPVYGNPPSDGYFANLNVGSFFYYHQISIGRIPAYYPSEAQTMVDKIITYESEQPAKWWKTFGYLTSGYTPAEQNDFTFRSNFELNTYVLPPSISGDSSKVYRSDNNGSTTINLKDSVLGLINKGALYVNFRGHAGSRDWEIMMNDPNTLSNGNKLPLVVSLTCFTGENAKSDLRGFGEKFVYLNGKGSIGFIGTTGWSFSTNGNNFGQFIIQTIRNDSTRGIGDLLKVTGKKMSADSLNFRNRHTVNSYNLIGDPAVKLRLPRIPEFVIGNSDYSLSNSTPSVNETTTLSIYPKNFGLIADSCKIRFQLKKNNQNYSSKDTVYYSFRYLDTVKHSFKLDSTGIYSMVVTLDQDNWYPLESKINNTAVINIPTKNTTIIPLLPVDNSVIYVDSVEFSSLNPNINYGGNTIKVILQLDTNKNFNSPILKTFVNTGINGVTTRFKTQLPLTNNNTLYHWRKNSVINNDSAGWSKLQSFVYNNGTGIVPGMKLINSSNPVVISKFDSDQYSESDFDNTWYYNNEIKLAERTAVLYVRSYGSNGEEASYFSVGNKNVYIDAGLNYGLNVLKVKKLNGSILQFRNFRINNAGSSDSLVAFLNTFDTTHYMMLLNASYDSNTSTFTAAAKNKLRQFGSVYCDSITLVGYFHTWSFIGFLGANSSQVSEMYDPCCTVTPGCPACSHWTPSISSMNVTFRKTSGTVSNIVGPAQTWTDFSWKQNLVPNTGLSFDVIGIDQNNNQTVLISNIQTPNFVDLSTIKAYEYPKLKLLTKFTIDTSIGNQSPSLISLKVNYSPVSELVLEKNSLVINAKTKANSTNFSFRYHNAGYSVINGTIVNVYNNSILDSNLLLTDTIKSVLKLDSSKIYSNNFNTPKFRDSTKIFIYIKPKGSVNEFYTYNNSVDFNISTPGTASYSSVEAYSDGKKISSGDYISKKPEIKINISGAELPSLLNDTNILSLKLNTTYIPYFIKGNINPILRTLDNDNSLPGGSSALLFYPELTDGKNNLSIVYKTGNESYDTLNYDVIVSNELLIKDLYNFPNPMRAETNFIFELAGSSISNRMKIRIYTVSGRLIRELENSVNIGNNQIPWDGKDKDGDNVANGTYLYKLVIDDESKTETKIQKLVMLK